MSIKFLHLCRACKDSNPSACEGPAKRYTSCNLQPCPRGYPDADSREAQCARWEGATLHGYFRIDCCDGPNCRYNSETFEGKLYSWIPYLRAPRKCELNCMPQGERFYYRHAKKVGSDLHRIASRWPRGCKAPLSVDASKRVNCKQFTLLLASTDKSAKQPLGQRDATRCM